MMVETGQMIDARDKFRSGGVKYEVTIEVKVTMRFIWTIVKCLWRRKDLRITHTFKNDPLLGGEE